MIAAGALRLPPNTTYVAAAVWGSIGYTLAPSWEHCLQLLRGARSCLLETARFNSAPKSYRQCCATTSNQ